MLEPDKKIIPTGEAPNPSAFPVTSDRVLDAYFGRTRTQQFMLDTQKRVHWVCGKAQGRRILDVGCSQGIVPVLLGREGYQVTGIDSAAEAIATAEAFLAEQNPSVQKNVTFICDDFTGHAFADQSFDTVILSEVLEHLVNPASFVTLAAQLLDKGGRLVVTVPFGINDFIDHKRTYYALEPMRLVWELFSVDEVELFGKWIGFSCSKRPAPVPEGLTDWPWSLIRQMEEAFQKIERLYLDQIRVLTAERDDVNKKYRLANEQVAQLKTQSSKLAPLEQTLATRESQLQSSETMLAALRNELGEIHAQRDEVNRECRAVTEQAGLLRERIAQADTELARSRQDVQEEQARRHTGEVELTKLQKRLTHQQTQATELRTILAETNLKHRDLTEQVALLRGQLVQDEAELDSLRNQLGSERAQRIAGEIELFRLQEQSRHQKSLADMALQARERRMTTLQEALERSHCDAESIRAQLKEENATLAGELAARQRQLEDARAAQPAPAAPETETLRQSLLNTQAEQQATQAALIKISSELEVTRAASLKGRRVACIMDEVTYSSYRPECNLLRLTPQHWQQELEAFVPELLFIESAWLGKDGLWAGKISDNRHELAGIAEWCRTHRIPTAFWNKEDPVHFERFLPVARTVDLIFTTDIDCIPRYKREIGHDRVYLLPCAAQPAIHNPIEIYPRKDAFNFTGSYDGRGRKHQQDFKNIVAVASEFKTIEIYDCNAPPPAHDFLFPDEYQPYILGKLPLDQIDKACKGYRFGLNLNTIKYSQTMFARRIFELLASNTVVVSNFSRGLRLFFGDLVISSDAPAELRRRIQSICADDLFCRKHRLAGLRKVLSEHTYAHRLAYLFSKVTDAPVPLPAPVVCMLGFPANRREAEQMVHTFERQSYPHRMLCLVGTGYSKFAVANRIHCATTSDAVQSVWADARFIAALSAHDYYGPNFLQDLVLATAYSDASVIGKGACYEYRDDAMALTGDGQQYRYVTELPARSALIATEIFTGLNIRSAADVADIIVSQPQMLSTDEFNYCRACGSLPGAETLRLVDDLAGVDTGLSWEGELAPLAEKLPAAPGGSISAVARKLPELDAAGWFALLPSEISNELEFTLTADEVDITFELPAEKHHYVYLTQHFPRAAFQIEQDDRFQIGGTAEGDLRLVFVFLNDKDEKISHTMAKVGRSFSLEIPSACASVRLGLRLQGSGRACLGYLLESRTIPHSVLVPRSKYLVLTNQYPAYDDLYRFGFLHSRVRAYKQQGHKVDVFRLHDKEEIDYREFEGIDVVSAHHAFLDTVLEQGAYTHVLVHILTKAMQDVLDRHLEGIKEIVWIHGAEIQPWYRRACNFTAGVNLADVSRQSDLRLAMWRELFSRQHPNLHMIFVSQYQAREVMNDLGVELSVDQYDIIPNFVDGELFAYHPKAAEQRKRILSIRPYASAVYANDLLVAAIKLLAKEPYFEQLEFKIVGDGTLFEETLAPLRGLSNVAIERCFLTQQEIANLHREYGLFLVPSRMDTQGVSRDEAMASGLVPVTNRVAAIPDFVDDSCAFLADPEDAEGLAEAIRCLYRDPELFMRMSEAAARHVRSISSFPQTIGRELRLLSAQGQPSASRAKALGQDDATMRIAIYGDVNLNITDGSAIWATSLAETIAGFAGVQVSLYLKARIRSTQIIAPLLHLSSKLRLVEPMPEDGVALVPAEALAQIEEDDGHRPYDAIILRGLDLCAAASRRDNIRGRIWAYLTDFPQHPDDISTEMAERLASIIDTSAYMLCQTRQFEAYLLTYFPTAAGKTRLLPPMIPMCPSKGLRLRLPDAPLRLVYAGKFAPLWGIREMFQAFELLRKTHPEAEFHIYGDKIHNPPDDPAFREEVRRRLEGGDGIHWHHAVPRETLMRELHNNDVGWAYRHAALEAHTHELSTKVLEYAACGLPVILARNAVNEDVLGKDYPLFADGLAEAAHLLCRLAEEPEFHARAVARLIEVCREFTFAGVRDNLRRQGLFRVA